MRCNRASERFDPLSIRPQGTRAKANQYLNTNFVRHFYYRVVPGIADRFDGPADVATGRAAAAMAINGSNWGGCSPGDGPRLRNRGGSPISRSLLDVEIPQIRRGLILLDRHQVTVGAEHILLLA